MEPVIRNINLAGPYPTMIPHFAFVSLLHTIAHCIIFVVVCCVVHLSLFFLLHFIVCGAATVCYSLSLCLSKIPVFHCCFPLLYWKILFQYLDARFSSASHFFSLIFFFHLTFFCFCLVSSHDTSF